MAEKMADLLDGPLREKLTDIELALLLLAAYLHDIGMSPKRDSVRRHFSYLLSGGEDLLQPSELAEFQTYLDGHWGDFTVPESMGAVATSGIIRSDEVMAYYCRHKHNDWSELWIRENLPKISPALYPNWIDDIVVLCKSHHEGLTELKSDRFQARVVSTPGQVVNLRFLACMLRVADVLEFDPERTPELILQHRSIAPKSRVFWHKDHGISLQLEHGDHRVSMSARTPNALIHRAVLETAEGVNRELAICASLEQSGSLRSGSIPREDISRYSWPWPAQVSMDVAEKDGTFTYINGAFRPDVKNLLSLLSGTELYGSPLAALREMIQNAFDAVKEQIALERLLNPNGKDPRVGDNIRSLHHIQVTLESEDGRLWLRCSDDGVGLSRPLIENHFLVSGSGTRADLIALERNCRSQGFSIGRTGKFGIGVLSYFMIADLVEITTKRSSEAGGVEPNGWTFRTEGVGSFGELTKASRSAKGTDVRIRLLDNIFPSGGENFARISSYLTEVICVAPCHVELRDEVTATPRISIAPGWARSTLELAKAVAEETKSTRFRSLRSHETTERAASKRRDIEALNAVLQKSLKWHGPFEHRLTSAEAIVRISLPYFEVRGNRCLAWLNIDENGRIARLPNEKEAFIPSFFDSLSWQGIGVSTAYEGRPRLCSIEIDFHDGGTIAVNRNEIRIHNRSEVFDEISKIERSTIRDFLNNCNDCKETFAINSHIASRTATTQRERFMDSITWKSSEDGNSQLRNLRFPAFDFLETSRPDRLITRFGIGEEEVYALQTIPCSSSSTSQMQLSSYVEGGRIAFVRPYGYSNIIYPAIVWDKVEQMNDAPLYCSTFPEMISDFFYISTGSGGLYNTNHEIIKKHGDDMIAADSFDIDHIEIGSLKNATSAWSILKNLGNDAEIWKAFRDHKNEEFLRTLEMLSISDQYPLYYLSVDEILSPSIMIISPTKIDKIEQKRFATAITLDAGERIWEADGGKDWITPLETKPKK